jgi:glutamine cyclotransferase
LKNANPLSLAAAALLALAGLGWAGCGESASPSAAPETVPVYTYEIVHVWPHDRGAFTEGLSWLQGGLLESTGIENTSFLRKVDLASGQVRQEVKLPPQYFGEGSVALGDKVYQLTWKTQKGFVYNLATLEEQAEFSYQGEGWGLTTDGRSLIMSNGSNQLQFLDPATFQVTRTLSVFSQGRPLKELNELEYVKGEIFANIWQYPLVARIDPATGRLLGLIDFSGLLGPADAAGSPPPDVLNGIAYDAADDRLFVTGKRWPKLFEVRLKLK